MEKSDIAAALRSIVGKENIIDQGKELACYTYNATPDLSKNLPAAVVFPADTGEVAAILKYASANKIPVITRGMATNVSAGAIPVSPECIILATKRLRGIEIDLETLTATVGAGEITADIQQEAKKHGLFYPPDPASYQSSSIAGNVAENAGGLLCVKYGTTKDYVLGLEAVLPSGDIINTGGKCIKNVAGYNLTQLLVGSEGTLGVITKVILKLIAQPERKKAMMVLFDDVENASKAVSRMMVSGAVPSIMEFMENTLLRATEEFCQMGLPVDAGALLLIEVDGEEAILDKKVAKIKEICEGLGAREIRIANTEQEAEGLWKARRVALPVMSRIAKGRLGGDPAVPINKLPNVIHKQIELGKKYNVKTCCAGHAGDGNVHPNFFFDTPEEKTRALKAREEFNAEIIKMGGTITGEHGIGRVKQKYLKLQLGETQLNMMLAIKKAFDPDNILNPGCMFGE